MTSHDPDCVGPARAGVGADVDAIGADDADGDDDCVDYDDGVAGAVDR